MRKEKTVAGIGVICLMIAMLFPINVLAAGSAGEGYSTPLTVTVPEQPEEEMVISTEGETLESVKLPEGWKWKEPDTKLIPGDYLEAIAVYEDGGTVTERIVRVGQHVKIIKDRTDTAYVIGRDTELTVTSTGELSALRKVEMDGKEVPSAKYSKKSGSTVLTFKKSYMDTLTVGSHTITLTYPVESVSTTVQVSKVQETAAKPSNTGTGNTGNSGSNAAGAKTGDETNMAVWLVLIMVSGAAAAGIYAKRRKKSR